MKASYVGNPTKKWISTFSLNTYGIYEYIVSLNDKEKGEHKNGKDISGG
jgi:hypothetical protein